MSLLRTRPCHFFTGMTNVLILQVDPPVFTQVFLVVCETRLRLRNFLCVCVGGVVRLFFTRPRQFVCLTDQIGS